MENVSIYVSVVFILTTLAAVAAFYLATKSKVALIITLIWMTVNALLGLNGFFREYDALPPRFMMFPFAILLMLVFVFSRKGKVFMEKTDHKWLTILHVVRIPVEIVLFQLFMAGLVPKEMTFEGYNFDILSGVTAVFVYYLVYVRKVLDKKWLLVWNCVCLALLINVVLIAILSAKTPLQQIALQQPNVGVGYFPFVWLPSIVVPIVLFSHIASIYKLYRK